METLRNKLSGATVLDVPAIAGTTAQNNQDEAKQSVLSWLDELDIGQSYVAAAVFGGGRSNWRLQQKCSLKKVGCEWKITESTASAYSIRYALISFLFFLNFILREIS